MQKNTHFRDVIRSQLNVVRAEKTPVACNKSFGDPTMHGAVVCLAPQTRGWEKNGTNKRRALAQTEELRSHSLKAYRCECVTSASQRDMLHSAASRAARLELVLRKLDNPL